MEAKELIKELKKYANPKNIEGMRRFGICGGTMLGGPNLPTLRKIAKENGKDHKIALELWASGIHEARILASMIDEPDKVSDGQMEAWVHDFDSWDVCDQICSNLFDKTKFARKKIVQWVKSDKEFVRRAGFVLMATLSVHDKKAEDNEFIKFFPLIKKYALDERNFVKKAVNWALRQIGKRNKNSRVAALKVAREIEKIDSKSARWIARDAIRELEKKS